MKDCTIHSLTTILDQILIIAFIFCVLIFSLNLFLFQLPGTLQDVKQMKNWKENVFWLICNKFIINPPFSSVKLLLNMKITHKDFFFTYTEFKFKPTKHHQSVKKQWQISQRALKCKKDMRKGYIFFNFQDSYTYLWIVVCCQLQLKRKMGKSLGFLLTVTMLLYSGNYLDWQGTGNMSQTNVTQVWSYIHSNFDTSWNYQAVTSSGSTLLANFAKGLSDNLNTLWNPAWNVVVVYTTQQYNDDDSVVYGYAFRDHWMWYNGYKMTGYYYANFIIWKDYNCIKWYTHNYNAVASSNGGSYYSYSPSTFSAISNAVQTYSGFVQSDIWSSAKRYVQSVLTYSSIQTNLGTNIAFTVVISHNIYSKYFARFCAKDYFVNQRYILNEEESTFGNLILIQIR